MNEARSVCALVRHRLLNCMHGRDCIVFMLQKYVYKLVEPQYKRVGTSEHGDLLDR